MTKTTRNDRSSEPSCRLLPSMPEALPAEAEGSAFVDDILRIQPGAVQGYEAVAVLADMPADSAISRHASASVHEVWRASSL